MKHKFWVYYLTLVLLFSGLAYVAISDDADVPLALSDSEMSVLRGTLANYRCVDNATFGCADSDCDQDPFGIQTRGQWYNDCRHYPDYNCNFRGPANAQITCRKLVYINNCSQFSHPDHDTIQNCK